jgi:hypothetical protein
MMGMFKFFFRKKAKAPQKSGIIGHWKKLEGGSREDLRMLITQLEDDDNATVIFAGDRNYAALTMFLLRRKLRPDKESLQTMIQGMLWRHSDAENEHTVFAATVHLSSAARHRKVAEERLLDKLYECAIEFRVFRGEEDLR